MLFENLAQEDLGEQVGRIDLSRNQLDRHDPRAAHLAHIEQLPVDVPRVLRGRTPMAQGVCPFVVPVAAAMGPSRR
eukprot:4390343-Prymnesium_polylepis.1